MDIGTTIQLLGNCLRHSGKRSAKDNQIRKSSYFGNMLFLISRARAVDKNMYINARIKKRLTCSSLSYFGCTCADSLPVIFDMHDKSFVPKLTLRLLGLALLAPIYAGRRINPNPRCQCACLSVSATEGLELPLE
jgi:hypothetical protein